VKTDVKQRRAARELSLGELATAVGVSRQTINSIEKGRYTPSLPLALALARYFETTVEEMFDGDD
jgi:putative transcriptional regulator